MSKGGPPKANLTQYEQPLPLLFFGAGDETLEDGSRYNPSVVSFIRDEWMHKQLQAREAEYTEYRALRVFVGTWNVNGKFPREDLTPWLCDGADADAEGRLSLPDVYVVGLQEMVDLTVTNVALGGQAGKRSEQWVQLLDRTLNSASASTGEKYELVDTRYLVGVMLAVFVKSKYKPFVGDVQDAEAPVGVMGMMAAHRNAVAQRNADFASIMAKTEFRDAAAVAAGKAAGQLDAGKLTILDHDFVIWFGDFNYRIVETVSTERCFELACGGDADLEQLRQRDQLNIERAAQRSFHGFQEGPLTFRPTYKFQPGTSTYEQRPEKKLRAPAWCDRILWRTSPAVDPRYFQQVYYGSVDELVASDHKAVHSIFEAAVRTIIRDKQDAVIEDLRKQRDAMENRSVPKVAISETQIHFADVVYNIPMEKTFTIENTGDVAALWHFVPKPEERWFCKTWMTVDSAYGMIPPGGSATIKVTINVDDAVARDISLGRELATGGTAAVSSAAFTAASGITPSEVGGLLEDVLVLRMERGRDYYLTVTAAVLPTCFGCSLSQLARRPEPMRALAVTEAETRKANASKGAVYGPRSSTPATTPSTGPTATPDLAAGCNHLAAAIASDATDLASGGSLSSSDASRKGSQLMSVPKEIWRLVDLLYRKGLDTRGIFLAPGEAADRILIRECLDTGEAFPATIDVLAVAEVLLDLLESLREPVIPTALFPGSDFKLLGVDTVASQILKNVAPLHYNVLVYVLRFAREVLAHASNNGASVDDLAYVFSRCMMRRIPHDEAAAHAPVDDKNDSVPSAGASGGKDDEEGGGSALVRTSLFADKGTRWEPTREEQEIMSRLFAHYITTASLT